MDIPCKGPCLQTRQADTCPVASFWVVHAYRHVTSFSAVWPWELPHTDSTATLDSVVHPTEVLLVLRHYYFPLSYRFAYSSPFPPYSPIFILFLIFLSSLSLLILIYLPHSSLSSYPISSFLPPTSLPRASPYLLLLFPILISISFVFLLTYLILVHSYLFIFTPPSSLLVLSFLILLTSRLYSSFVSQSATCPHSLFSLPPLLPSWYLFFSCFFLRHTFLPRSSHHLLLLFIIYLFSYFSSLLFPLLLLFPPSYWFHYSLHIVHFLPPVPPLFLLPLFLHLLSCWFLRAVRPRLPSTTAPPSDIWYLISGLSHDGRLFPCYFGWVSNFPSKISWLLRYLFSTQTSHFIVRLPFLDH